VDVGAAHPFAEVLAEDAGDGVRGIFHADTLRERARAEEIFAAIAALRERASSRG